MTTLIVGCGYLGRRMAARLLKGGERVIGTTRDPAKAAGLERVGVEPLLLDVIGAWADPPALRSNSAPATPHPNPPPQGGRRLP